MLRLGCIWTGSHGQLGYHVMEKITIFSPGSLTYLSPLTDTPPRSTPTFAVSSLPLFSLSVPPPHLPLAFSHSLTMGLSHSPLLRHANSNLTMFPPSSFLLLEHHYHHHLSQNQTSCKKFNFRI